MSNTEKDEPQTDRIDEPGEETDAPDAETAQTDPSGDRRDVDLDDPTPEPPAPEPVVEKKGGASATIAWLALFLALVTIAGVGYLLLEQYRAASDAADEAGALSALSARLDETAQSIDDIRSRLGSLASADAATTSALESLQRDLDERGTLFDSVPPRMTNLERSVASLQGVSMDARNTYLVAEAEYYLQIANAQLQLAGNPYLASLALDQADDRLLQVGDPALTDVRRAIADEAAALEVMEQPDVAGLSLTLASLARVVESLPLRTQPDAGEDTPVEPVEQPGAAARAWNTVKGAVAGLVKHTPPGDADATRLQPEAEPLIRSNLALQLQAARLAMLRGEAAIFEQSVADADAWLVSHFDTVSEPVAAARATLAEILGDYSESAPPDISGSLRLLRQYKALVEPDQ